MLVIFCGIQMLVAVWVCVWRVCLGGGVLWVGLCCKEERTNNKFYASACNSLLSLKLWMWTSAAAASHILLQQQPRQQSLQIKHVAHFYTIGLKKRNFPLSHMNKKLKWGTQMFYAVRKFVIVALKMWDCDIKKLLLFAMN